MDKKIIGCWAFLFMLILTTIVKAVPGIPHAFYGYVYLNGKAAPDGTLIVAKIDGKEVARTTTSKGKYGYPLGSFYVDDPNNDRSGSIITFFVNGIASKTAIFCNGCITRLDLSVQTQEGGAAPTGGGGGLILPPEGTNETQANETEEEICEERWVCSEWSECVNGIQTRVCRDVNECGTEKNKPLTSQPCVIVEGANETKAKNETTTQPLGITGLVSLIRTPAYLLILILAIIAILLTVFRIRISKLVKKKGTAFFKKLFA